MPFLLARLGRVIGPDTREVRARGRIEPQQVGPDVRDLRDGTVVLLGGTHPPWATAHTVNPTGWPEGLPGPQALWKARRPGSIRVAVDPACGSRGNWVLDHRGTPCEVGFGRSDGPVAIVLNYAGWRISDLPAGGTEVAVCDTDVGTVWIVTPQAVAHPVEEPAVAAATKAPIQWLGPAGAPETGLHAEPWPAAGVRPRPHAAPQPSPFELRLRFRDVDFTEGAVALQVQGHHVSVPSAHSRHVYQEVRELFDEVLTEGVLVVGTLRAHGAEVTEIQGLDAMAAMFGAVEFRAFVRRSCAAEAWLDGDDLAASRPGGPGRRDPADLLDIPGFGFDRRADAFRRLLAIRGPEERVGVLPGRAMVIPLAAVDGGPFWYAWETVVEDHATYIFRPTTKAGREALDAWAQKPGAKRQELLDDKALQAELGYARRVVHHDDADDALGRWWAGLCRAIGRPVRM